jgi:hypothetical protein
MISSRALTLQALLLIALAPSLLHAFPAGGSAWSANANRHRGQNGQRFTYSCPAGGGLYRIWGTDVYTDDSSVCTAAVHAGLIVLNTGGNVTIEIRPGQDSYTPSTRNRVRSDAHGPWTGSFVFTGERSSGVRARSTTTDWNTTAANHRGHIGQRFSYSCPGNGEPGNVWGSGIYTDDSSVCTAAVHHGSIGWNGGSVAIEIRPGQSSYRGSTSHRVESKSYGAFSGSFMFLQ